MWENLSQTQKEEYKKMILVFASLTELFSQKKANEESDEKQKKVPAPIINSKYQETIFQRAFHATPEDIKNTSFDASLKFTDDKGEELRYIVGIKTFQDKSECQKIAQFKSKKEWRPIIDEIIEKSKNLNTTDAIKSENENRYLKLATLIAEARNSNLQLHKTQLNGFSSSRSKKIEAVYHVLLSSKKQNKPFIFVKEYHYEPININRIKIEGPASLKNPGNFIFTDGKNRYKFTSQDCQLHMYFKKTVDNCDTWPVEYVEDAYDKFSKLAIYTKPESEAEAETHAKLQADANTHFWPIKTFRYSGFNNFNSLSNKQAPKTRTNRINSLKDKFNDTKLSRKITAIISALNDLDNSNLDKNYREQRRLEAIKIAKKTQNDNLIKEVINIAFRNNNEFYIPIPEAKKFHDKNPNFFAEGAGKLKKVGKTWKLPSNHKERTFTITFEPSGEQIECYLTQDCGKAIQSVDTQLKLGEWVLRHVFQLKEYEPLTEKHLKKLGIDSIKIYKTADGQIHMQFV